MKKVLSIKKSLALIAVLFGDSGFPTGTAIVRMFPFTPYIPPSQYVNDSIYSLGHPKPAPTVAPYVPFNIYIPPANLPPAYVPPPLYVPHINYLPYRTYSVDDSIQPEPTPMPKPIPRKPKVLGISTTDRQAPDFIPSKQAPVVVERIFKEVFGNRALDSRESKYWKLRARTDKATENKLRITMKYFLSRGWTYRDLQ